MNTVVKVGIGVAVIGAIIYGVKKARDYANGFQLEVVRYGIPKISQSVIYLPVVVKFNNPSSVPINIDNIAADVYLLKSTEYTKVGQVKQPLSIPPGGTEQIITVALSLKSIFGGNILTFATALVNTKSLTFRTDVTANYAGVSLPVQTITNTIYLKDFTTVSGLGLVASAKRKIKDGVAYNKFFKLNDVQGNEVRLMKDGSVYDTLKEMERMSSKYKYQTKFIAEKLKASSLQQSLNNLWDFLYNNVQYKKDHPLREQLRTPLRLWKDRQSGVDCDCYSIFISSVLKNWNVKHAFRMAAYSGDFQHVYVVVPTGDTMKQRSQYVVVDPVADKFNYEAPFTKKYDTSWK